MKSSIVTKLYVVSYFARISAIPRQGPPQAVMFLSRAVKGTKLKTEAMELLGKLAPTIKVLKSVIHQKQVIADSSGQAATVWDLGGQPAKDSGKEYSRLFKEIMGALT